MVMEVVVEVVVVEGVDVVRAGFFFFFRPVCLGYDGSEDGDRSCGWVVELVWWKWSVVWEWV